MTLLADARALAPDLVRLRRRLHRRPETGLRLPYTQEAVLRELDGLGLEITTGRALTSVVAVLRGGAVPAPASPGGGAVPGSPGPGGGALPGRAAPAVLLRADLDALPLRERTGIADASRVPDAMHACGHDLHAAMLVGAARLLAERRHRLAGDVVLMFQPGEEGHDGARLMLDEGLLDASGRRPVAAYALHATTAGPLGAFTNRAGPALAGSGSLTVTVRGAGGHSAWPHTARDPIPALCETVTALQSAVTRSFDPFEPVVLGVGVLRAGTQAGIIPGTATFEATLRALTGPALARLRDLAVRTCRGVAAAHGLEVDIEYTDGYPATLNDAGEAGFVGATVAELHGEHRFTAGERPAMVSDDIGRVLAAVPGVMTSLGARPPGLDRAAAAPNHSPYALFDDSVLSDGAALLAELALRRLAAQADPGRA
ncbi:M20 family metallopeptidase [Kitasatospora sp. NBC_00315]|uniref:M20 metallopeptidase family protein n=1 Tax=Kitasatospora sp. NBC_00315 TaxID=2975963 RepID=UPI00324C81A0